MKVLEHFTLRLDKCRKELAEFKKLLDLKESLSEQDDILPFLRQISTWPRS